MRGQKVLVDLVDGRFEKYISKSCLLKFTAFTAFLYVCVSIGATLNFYLYSTDRSFEVVSLAVANNHIVENIRQSFKDRVHCTTTSIKDDTQISNNVGSILATVGQFKSGLDPTCMGKPDDFTNKCPDLLFGGPGGRIRKPGNKIMNFSEATAMSLALDRCANDITPESCNDTKHYEYLDLDRKSVLSLFTSDGLLAKSIGVTAKLTNPDILVQNLRSVNFDFKSYDIEDVYRYEMNLFIDKVDSITEPDNSTRFEYDLDYHWCLKTSDSAGKEVSICNRFENERVICPNSLQFCLPICQTETNCTVPRTIIQKYVRKMFTTGSYNKLLDYLKSDFRNKHFITCETWTFVSLKTAISLGNSMMNFFVTVWVIGVILVSSLYKRCWSTSQTNVLEAKDGLV